LGVWIHFLLNISAYQNQFTQKEGDFHHFSDPTHSPFKKKQKNISHLKKERMQ
jgi:hypothetical protein